MSKINNDLKSYIEKEILPIYKLNDSGHDIDHINYVIDRSFKLASSYDDIDLNILYAIACFHDIAHHIDKDKHEVLSAEYFYKDSNMKAFFNEDERTIIKEAIKTHRASSLQEPKTIYGKIISSADRETNIDTFMVRMEGWTVKYFPGCDTEKKLYEAYIHMVDKYGSDGYAKNYIEDEDYLKFRKEISYLIKNKEEFRKRYINANKL